MYRWRFDMKHAGPTRDERIDLLKRWALVQAKADGRSNAERRFAYNRISKPQEPEIGRCWACKLGNYLITHHVVQIQNGGNSFHLNFIKICEDCHALVHPWLAGKSKQEFRSSTVGFAREIPLKIKSAPEKSGGEAASIASAVNQSSRRNPGNELVLDPAIKGCAPVVSASRE